MTRLRPSPIGYVFIHICFLYIHIWTCVCVQHSQYIFGYWIAIRTMGKKLSNSRLFSARYWLYINYIFLFIWFLSHSDSLPNPYSIVHFFFLSLNRFSSSHASRIFRPHGHFRYIVLYCLLLILQTIFRLIKFQSNEFAHTITIYLRPWPNTI